MSHSARPIIVGPLPPPVHGSSVMTSCLLNALNVHFDCDAINSATSGELARIGHAGLKNVLGSVRVICKVGRLLVKRRPIVYLAPSQMGPAVVRDLIIWLLAAARADGVLIHIHGCGFHRLGIDNPYIRRILVRALSRRSHFILLGERYSEQFLSGIPTPKSISYLPNTITPLATQALSKPRMRRREDSVVRLLYLGSISRYKLFDGLRGILTSRMIVKKLLALGTRLDIVIAGQFHGHTDAEEFDQIRSLTSEQMRIEYRGPVFDSEEKARLFASADCFLLPSTHPTEGLPVTLIEALCAGLPIIASDIGLCSDAVTEQNGWLVGPGDIAMLEATVVELLHEWGQRQLGLRRIASRALFNERFSHATFETKLLEILQGQLGIRALTAK